MKYRPPVPSNPHHCYRKIGTYKEVLEYTSLTKAEFNDWLPVALRSGIIIAQDCKNHYLWILDRKPPKDLSLNDLYAKIRQSAQVKYKISLALQYFDTGSVQ